MIEHQLGVNLSFGRDRSKFFSLGSAFELLNYKLLLSVGPRIGVIGGVDGNEIIKVREGLGNPYVYNWCERKRISLDNDFPDANESDTVDSYLVKELNPNERIVCLKGKEVHIFGDVGKYFFSKNNYLLFKKKVKKSATEIYCFDFCSGIKLWKCIADGVAYEVDGLVTFWYANHIEKKTEASVVDLSSGKFFARRDIDGVAIVGLTGKDRLYGVGLVDKNWFVFEYEPENDHIEYTFYSDLDSDNKISQIEFIGENYYIYYNNFPSEKSTENDSNGVVVAKYSIGGQCVGRVNIINVEVKRPINRCEDCYFARAISRGNVYTQREYILSWSEQDFLKETSENHIEKLNSICKKNIGQDGKHYYTISLVEENENFFQLFRQMSMGVYELVMTTAREYDHESCKFDQNFYGTVYCDVANHKLDKRERVSIENMCQHLEHEFADYASFDREMWKIPVKVIPLFAE